MQPNEQQITNFMMPSSTLGKAKKPVSSSVVIKQAPQKPKVTEGQSVDIMNSLFNQLDSKQADELEELGNSAAVMAELNKPIALNKEDQLYSKYNVTLAEVSGP